MKYHHPKIAPGRRMSFNPTFRGMSVLRAMQKHKVQRQDSYQKFWLIEALEKMLTMREHNPRPRREMASNLEWS